MEPRKNTPNTRYWWIETSMKICLYIYSTREPENHWEPSKEKVPHLENVCLPGVSIMLRVCVVVKQLKLRQNGKFLAVQNGFTQKEMHSVRIIGTTGAAGILKKRWRTERPSVPLYLNELPIEKCQFWSQIRPQSPAKGLPPVAPWHHVGATMDITLDKTGSFKRSIRNWVL